MSSRFCPIEGHPQRHRINRDGLVS